MLSIFTGLNNSFPSARGFSMQRSRVSEKQFSPSPPPPFNPETAYPRVSWLVCWLYWWLLQGWGRLTVPVKEMLLHFDLDVWGLIRPVAVRVQASGPPGQKGYRTTAWVCEALGGPPPSRGGRDLLVLLSWCPFSSGWIDSCFCRSVRWVSHVFCDEVRGGGHTAWSEPLHLCWKKTKMWAYD